MLLPRHLAAGALLLALSSSSTIHAQIMSLEELSSTWIDAQALADLPSISSEIGSVGTLADLVDASSFIAPPFISGTSMVTMRLDGRDLTLQSAKWTAYEASRSAKLVPIEEGHELVATSRLRMVPGEAGLMWEVMVASQLAPNVSLELAKTEDTVHTLELLAAVLARKQDELGWIVSPLPDDPREFYTKLVPAISAVSGGDQATAEQPAMVLHADTKSPARSGFVFVGPQPRSLVWVEDPSRPKASQALAKIELQLPIGTSMKIRFAMAMGEESEELLMARLTRYHDQFDDLWASSRGAWTALWDQAFTPQERDSSRPFNGHLPVLSTEDAPIRRLYYMSCLTLLAMRRQHMSAVGGTAWVTGLGNTCWLTDPAPTAQADCLKAWSPRDTPLYPVFIGANAQFFWDTSLRSLLTSLLDQEAMRAYIHTVLAMPAPGYHESFGIDCKTGSPLGYSYSFNAHSIFTLTSTYLRASNDSALLSEALAGRTVSQHLEALALEWTGLVSKASDVRYLADYGDNVDNFLECVPSYLHAVSALQAGNVEMVSWLAGLREEEGNTTGASALRWLAQNLTSEMSARLYNRGKGYWSCLYPDSTARPVRHVIDFLYVARGLEAAGRGPGLDAQTRQEMSGFFRSELQTKDWLKALSPADSLNRVIPRDRAILRPDHGITGAYDAWVALSAEALAVVDGRWDRSLDLLRNAGQVTHQGPFGQAHEVDDVTGAFKTKRGFTRFLADNGASFAEVVIRGLFGYNPPFLAHVNASLPFQGLERCISRSDQPRGNFSGTLTGLKTPYGLATLSTGSEGIKIQGLERGGEGGQQRKIRAHK